MVIIIVKLTVMIIIIVITVIIIVKVIVIIVIIVIIVVTGQTNLVFVFDQLPSGRFKSVKARVNIRSDCFRFLCVRKLNSILF